MANVAAHAASDVDGDLRNTAEEIDAMNRTRLPSDGGDRGQARVIAEEPLQGRGEHSGRQPIQIRQQRLVRWGAATLLVADMVVAAGAPAVNYFVPRYNTPLEAGAAMIAVVTFLGVWLLQRQRGAGRDDRNSMRDGIAAAFVVTYLVIVGWAAFMKVTEDQMPPLAQALIGNFTVLVGVVVGGYFGADTVKQVTLINAKRRQQGGEASV